MMTDYAQVERATRLGADGKPVAIDRWHSRSAPLPRKDKRQDAQPERQTLYKFGSCATIASKSRTNFHPNFVRDLSTTFRAFSAVNLQLTPGLRLKTNDRYSGIQVQRDSRHVSRPTLFPLQFDGGPYISDGTPISFLRPTGTEI